VFPVLVTAKYRYITTLPVPPTAAVSQAQYLDFESMGSGWSIVYRVPDTSVTSFPFGSFAVAKAVFTTLASISA
jgi:hypothetical protein